VGHTKSITMLHFLRDICTLVSFSTDGSFNFWGYSRIIPPYYKNKCYLKLLCTDLEHHLIPIRAGMYMKNTGMFSKKMTIEIMDHKSTMTQFSQDTDREAIYAKLRQKRPKYVIERPEQAILSDRFKNKNICKYLQEAFNIQDDKIEEAEDEAMSLYFLNKQLMENYMMYKNTVPIEYIIVGDDQGNIHIYAINELIGSKNLSSSEIPKNKLSVVLFSTQTNTNFKRENLNVTQEVETRTKNGLNYYIPHTLEANNCIRLKKIKAHQDRVLCIQTICHVKYHMHDS
jgi:hypothetical protein